MDVSDSSNTLILNILTTDTKMYKIYIDLVIQQDKTTFPLKQDRFHPSIKFKGKLIVGGLSQTTENCFSGRILEKVPKTNHKILFLHSYPLKFQDIT